MHPKLALFSATTVSSVICTFRYLPIGERFAFLWRNVLPGSLTPGYFGSAEKCLLAAAKPLSAEVRGIACVGRLFKDPDSVQIQHLFHSCHCLVCFWLFRPSWFVPNQRRSFRDTHFLVPPSFVWYWFSFIEAFFLLSPINNTNRNCRLCCLYNCRFYRNIYWGLAFYIAAY